MKNRLRNWLIRKLGGTPNEDLALMNPIDPNPMSSVMVSYIDLTTVRSCVEIRPEHYRGTTPKNEIDDYAKKKLIEGLASQLKPDISETVDDRRLIHIWSASIKVSKSNVLKGESDENIGRHGGIR